MWGLEKQKGVDLNFLPKNEQSYEIANKKIVDSKNFTIAAHGNSNYIYEYPNASKENNIRGNGKKIEPTLLAEIIKKHPNYNEGETIVLWACNTGNENTSNGDCYAQKLADALGPGSKVIAPTKYYFISTTPNGENYIGGQDSNGNIDYNVEKGRMKVFRGSCNGK
ncbi:MAG: hypothetical protein ACI4LS_06900 [Treponema sp.]